MSMRKLTKSEIKARDIKVSKGEGWWFVGLDACSFYFYNVNNGEAFKLRVPTASIRAALRQLDAQRAPKRVRKN
jgi:hypothetical protein